MNDIASLNSNLPTYFEALDSSNTNNSQSLLPSNKNDTRNRNDYVVHTIPSNVIPQASIYPSNTTILQSSPVTLSSNSIQHSSTSQIYPSNTNINSNLPIYSNQMNFASLHQHQSQPQPQPQPHAQVQAQPSPSPYSNNTIISPLNGVPLSTPPPQYYVVNKNMTPPSTYLSYPNVSPATMGMNTTMGAMPTPANHTIVDPMYQTSNTNSVMLPPSMLQQNPMNHAYSAPVFSNTLSPPSLSNHNTNANGLPMTMTSPTILPSNSNTTPIISTPHTHHTTPLSSNPITTGSVLPPHLNTSIVPSNMTKTSTTNTTILPNDFSSSTPVISTELGNPLEIGTNATMAVMPPNEMGTPLHGSITPGVPSSLFTFNSADPTLNANAGAPLVIPTDANNGIILESPQVASMGTPITRSSLDGLTPPTRTRTLRYDGEMVPLFNIGATPSSTHPKEFINSLPTPTDSFTMKCTMSKEGITLDSIAESPIQEMVSPIMPIPLSLPMPISPKEELLKQTTNNTSTNINSNSNSNNIYHHTSSSSSSNASYPSPQTINRNKAAGSEIKDDPISILQNQYQAEQQQQHFLTEEPTPMPTPINNPVVQTTFVNTLPNSTSDINIGSTPLTSTTAIPDELVNEVMNDPKEMKNEDETKMDLLTYTDLIKEASIQNNDLSMNDLLSDNTMKFTESKDKVVKSYSEPLLEELESSDNTILTLMNFLDEASIQNKKVISDDLLIKNDNNYTDDANVKTENIRKEFTFKKHSKSNNTKEKKERDTSVVKTLEKEETSAVTSVEKKDDEKPESTTGVKRKEIDSEVNTNKVKKQKLEENKEVSLKNSKTNSIPTQTKTKVGNTSTTTYRTTTTTTDSIKTTIITIIETSKNSKKRGKENASKEEKEVAKKQKPHKNESEIAELMEKSKEIKSKEGKTRSKSKSGVITKVKYNCNNINVYDSELKALLKYQTKEGEDVYPLRCICEGDIDEKEVTFGLDSLVCSYPNCCKVFTKSIHLEKHFIEHGEDFRPYQCPNCTKNFRRRYDLVRHVRIHNYIIPYRCSRCFRGFTRSDSCARHTKTKQCRYYDFSQLGTKKVHPPFYIVTKDPEEKTEKGIIIVPLNKLINY
ncbi:hypothetical protein LY90DRAFT_669568 [Neocallimastix californiae]|uniref:C2H2-type domain-containing protein n=1 Tax=Neocallimastix californiae TaxID=1754190 RepID=A0A1Y2D939_9FUNG|nr:hypothetical protein LY90DRAFT_669568 [Neocallimastix californiae]|eukprot:ORY55781.1 hypothetical protein LY90DRAFT_669568 [Neocallimastix californiae]